MNQEYKYLKLSTQSRFVIVVLLYAAAPLIQFLTGNFIPGIPLYILSWPFLMLKPLTNKPDDQGFEEWKPVGTDEIDRLYENLKESKKLRARFGIQWGCAVGIIILSGLTVFFMVMGLKTEIGWLMLNIFLMLIPAMFFGNARIFVPRELEMKAGSFYALLARQLPKGTVITPYLRFDKDPKGKPIPEDIRMMLELKRHPGDFMGVQFQIAINNGPNGAVPYMYAVILTHGKSGLSYAQAKSKNWMGVYKTRFAVEAGGDNEYGTVVIRQHTAGGGYHTTGSDVLVLFDAVLNYVAALGQY